MPPQPFVVPWPLSQYLNPIHIQEDSLDLVLARRKVLYSRLLFNYYYYYYYYY
jgi:hypothetical protein